LDFCIKPPKFPRGGKEKMGGIRALQGKLLELKTMKKFNTINKTILIQSPFRG